MGGKNFELGIPDEVLETVIIKAGGKQYRFPPPNSGHNPLFKRKRDRNICSECEKGVLIKEISIQNELSEIRIKQILKENGIKTREGKIISLKEKIKLMLKVRYSIKAIAKELGVTRQWVHNIIKKEGLKENE